MEYNNQECYHNITLSSVSYTLHLKVYKAEPLAKIKVISQKDCLVCFISKVRSTLLSQSPTYLKNIWESYLYLSESSKHESHWESIGSSVKVQPKQRYQIMLLWQQQEKFQLL